MKILLLHRAERAGSRNRAELRQQACCHKLKAKTWTMSAKSWKCENRTHERLVLAEIASEQRRSSTDTREEWKRNNGADFQVLHAVKKSRRRMKSCDE